MNEDLGKRKDEEKRISPVTLNKSTALWPIAATAVLILAVVLRCIGLDKGVWLDEHSSISWLDSSSLGELLDRLRSDVHPPLYFALLYYWSQLLGSGEEVLRLFSVVTGSGVVAIFLLWLYPYSQLAAVLGGAYLATNPVVLRFSQEIRPYSLLMLLTVLAFFFASHIATKPYKWRFYLGLGSCLCAAAATHLLSQLLLLPLLAFILLKQRMEGRAVSPGKLVVAFAAAPLIFLYQYFVFLFEPLARGHADWLPELSTTLVVQTFNYLLGMFELHSSAELKFLNVILFAFLVALIFIFGRFRSPAYSLALPIFLAVVLFLAEVTLYSLFVRPVFWYRTFLPMLIPFSAVISLQLASIAKIKPRRAAALAMLALTVSFAMQWLQVDAYRPVEHFKKAAATIESSSQVGDLVVPFPQYIGDTVRYLLPQVPNNDFLETFDWLDDDGENVKNFYDALRERLGENDAGAFPKRVWMVVRVDLKKDVAMFEEALSVLTATIPQSFELNIALVRCHDRDFVPSVDMMAEHLRLLGGLLGKPDQQEVYPGFTFASYVVGGRS